ncbi:MAG: hypothetical protein ABI822_23455 [Bryobacteraceae bacterium]
MLLSVAIIELAMLAGGTAKLSAKTMTKNERYLDQARTLAQAFESQSEPERLRDASMALANVVLAQESALQTRIHLRADVLRLWLHLLNLMDHSYDPKFNPSDVPDKLVQPPPLSSGEILRPGADPARIADPKARAKYEREIAANRAKNRNYRTQLQLHRLNERLTHQAESFIRDAYSPAPGDEKELSAAISEIIKNPERKTKLKKLVK